ncbi:8a3f5db0-829b-49a3-b38a-b1ce077c3919 [Thermothielavioides terrestris]|uniref:8a3f5db0-829b-49a3-b38a-b1ce077c3919 n=1 Tax=Thermothielavioides terrestris TaxID=2587410 RepID=A0A446BS95_9PEZI|nr:8a3f5db0-829b-49a3-b38a-b1ce077c3919 [Thermothielavioides terrestris]
MSVAAAALGGGGAGRYPSGDDNEDRNKNDKLSIGGFVVEGDSDDEENELLPDKGEFYVQCVARLLSSTKVEYTPSYGKSCEECRRAYTTYE